MRIALGFAAMFAFLAVGSLRQAGLLGELFYVATASASGFVLTLVVLAAAE